jgi:hypothetical protein
VGFTPEDVLKLERAEAFADRTETVRAMEAMRAAVASGTKCSGCSNPATLKRGDGTYFCRLCAQAARQQEERRLMRMHGDPRYTAAEIDEQRSRWYSGK